MIKTLYLISCIVLFVLCLLIKKNNSKNNFIISFIISICVFFSYNIVCALFLKMMNVLCSLDAFFICNIIPIVILFYLIIRKKEIQKYYIEVKDLIAVFIICFVVLIVMYINFNMPLDISFVQVDISNHYQSVIDFMNNGEVKTSSLSGAYINYGIAFKLFFDYNQKLNGYYLFIVLEMLKLMLSGIMFYLVVKKFIKNKTSLVITIILAIIYMLGYPLNGILSGFVYLQIAVNIVGAIFIIIIDYNRINNEFKNICLFLLSFGLMFTYYILVPPVFVSLFLYKLKDFKENKINTCIQILEIFFIPCLAGITYFILPSFIDNNNFNPANFMTGQMADEGYIFVNYFSMFLFFIPFNIYYLIEKIKNKKNSFLCIMLITNIVYIIIVLILNKLGIIARYYSMKPYYLLWLVMLEITGISIAKLLNSNINKIYKHLTILVCIFYLLGLVVCVFILGPVGIKVFENEKEGIYSMYNIFRLNRGIVLSETFELIYSNKDLELLNNFFEDIRHDENVIFLEDALNSEWARKLFFVEDQEYNDAYLISKNFNKAKDVMFNSEEKIYIVCYKNEFIKQCFDFLLKDLDANLIKVVNDGKLVIYTNK